jgi:hypothetical protein
MGWTIASISAVENETCMGQAWEFWAVAQAVWVGRSGSPVVILSVSSVILSEAKNDNPRNKNERRYTSQEVVSVKLRSFGARELARKVLILG